MISKKEVEKLAELSRIKIEEKEKGEVAREIDSILSYIDQIKRATLDMDHTPTNGVVYNVFREDIADSISKQDRDAILAEAPDREGDFIAVKKIIPQ